MLARAGRAKAMAFNRNALQQLSHRASNKERRSRDRRFCIHKERPSPPGAPQPCGGGTPPFLDQPLSNNSLSPLVPLRLPRDPHPHPPPPVPPLSTPPPPPPPPLTATPHTH